MTAPRPLVEAHELHDLLQDDPSVVVLDCSWRLNAPSLRSEYEVEHLPGAAWVEFEQALSGPARPGDAGRHPMPDPEVFVAAMRAAGVDNDERVVVTDRDNGQAAARLWWLLGYHGHERVQVLNGGVAAWRAAGLPLSAEPVLPQRGDFVSTPGLRPLLDADGAAEFATQHLLLDARPADRFAGRNESIDPVAGHIPGAISAPSADNVDAQGRFLTGDDLAMRLTALGVRPGQQVGIYCGSGVSATHAALALAASGLETPAAVYIGSWSDWITDPDRPVAGPTD
ncbi:sulfurtransferase [Dermacoccaceae bacterium W4C1]